MINIPKEICDTCGTCCHGEPGMYVVARTHKGDSPQISEKGNCQYLNYKNKCKLGCKKPIECAIYPIRIFSNGVYVDKQCPAWEIAVKQWELTHGIPMEEWKDLKSANYIKVST